MKRIAAGPLSVFLTYVLLLVGNWVGHLCCEGVCGAELRKLPQCLLPLAVAGNIFTENKKRKLNIFQVASNVSLVAETRVRKKSVSMPKLNCES